MARAIDVVLEPERAAVLLDRTRLQLLGELAAPRSAAAVARQLGLPRQRVNYHLRELERQRLVECVAEHARGSCVERSYRRSGDAYAVSSAALGELAPKPDAVADRFSSDYQIALASRAVEELSTLQVGAQAQAQALPTFSLAVEVTFASAASRSQFAEELSAAVAALVQKHHDAASRGGRTYRFYVGAYPKPKAGAAGKGRRKRRTQFVVS
jgi:DNA-binding transcriptional ArsR family regulator